MIRILTCIALAAGAWLAMPAPAWAAQSYDNCTGFIASLPATINTQGTWCLNKDLTTNMISGVAITIATNNVTIDCNDFKIGGLASGPGTQARGIEAVDKLNATVRHCNIRGFYEGVYFSLSSGTAVGGGHVVEDNRFDGNTYVAVTVAGDGSVIRRNQVFDTGGSTVQATPLGIYTFYTVDVLDNTVSGVAATSGSDGYAFGMFLSPQGSSTSSVSGNRVRGVVKDGTGLAIGIKMNSTDRYVLSENHVFGDGSAGSVGLQCFNSSGRAKDNVVGGFPTAIEMCGDAGGNDSSP